jgi:hypothetical protein
MSMSKKNIRNKKNAEPSKVKKDVKSNKYKDDKIDKNQTTTTAQRMAMYENMKMMQDFDYILRRNDILIQQLEAL